MFDMLEQFELVGDRTLLARPRLALFLPRHSSPDLEARAERLLKACADRGIVVVVPNTPSVGWWCLRQAAAAGARLIAIDGASPMADLGHSFEARIRSTQLVVEVPEVDLFGPSVGEALVALSTAAALVGQDVASPYLEAWMEHALVKRHPTCILPAAATAEGAPLWAKMALVRGAKFLTKPSELDWIARLAQP